MQAHFRIFNFFLNFLRVRRSSWLPKLSSRNQKIVFAAVAIGLKIVCHKIACVDNLTFDDESGGYFTSVRIDNVLTNR